MCVFSTLRSMTSKCVVVMKIDLQSGVRLPGVAVLSSSLERGRPASVVLPFGIRRGRSRTTAPGEPADADGLFALSLVEREVHRGERLLVLRDPSISQRAQAPGRAAELGR